MRTLLSGLMTVALAAGGAGLAADSSATTAVSRLTATPFALGGSAFGTLVRGGQLPASSVPTAYDAIGCTNKAGVEKENHLASVNVPGLGQVSGAATRVWTEDKGGAVSEYSLHTIAKVTIADSPLGSLSIEGLRTKTRAWHDASGFHASADTAIGEITFTPPVGPAQTLPIPTPGQPLTVPGLATIAVGHVNKMVAPGGARTGADAAFIKVIPTDTAAHVGHAQSQIGSPIRIGLFHGRSYATKITALDDNVSSGPQPIMYMACQGTYGQVKKKSIAGVNLPGALDVDGLRVEQSSSQTEKLAKGYEKASIAKVNLGDGALVITGIEAVANVSRRHTGVTANANGTTIGSIVANGQPMAFPDTGVLEIPGVAKLENKVVTRSKTGISVIALRLTLLDGTGAVVNLGFVELKIGKA